MFLGTETARGQLKAKTDRLHQRLHHLPVFERLLDGSLSLNDYVGVMSCFHDFYRQLDPKISVACEIFETAIHGYDYQSRASMFESDISALSDRVPFAVNQTRVRHALPEIVDVPSLAGVVYVVDGSVLGGITMNKAVALMLESDSPEGRSYWNWCRTHGALQWKSALKLVETSWLVQRDRPKMIDSAVQTFRALNGFLETTSTSRPVFAE